MIEGIQLREELGRIAFSRMTEETIRGYKQVLMNPVSKNMDLTSFPQK